MTDYSPQIRRLVLCLLCCGVTTGAFACNEPPIAEICSAWTPYYQSVCPGTVVRLDGSWSYDPDGWIFTYEWRRYKHNGSYYQYETSTQGSPVFWRCTSTGRYKWELWVQDDDYAWCDWPDTCYVDVVEVDLDGGGHILLNRSDNLDTISLSIDPDLDFGEVRLSKSTSPGEDGDVSVYYDSAGTNEVTLPKGWLLSRGPIPSTLYVRGTSASSALEDVTLTLSYIQSSETVDSDAESFTVFDVQISKCDSQWLPKKHGVSGYKTNITASVTPSLPTISKEYEFHLFDASTELGYCVNRGWEPVTENDLKFETQGGFAVSGTQSEFAEITTTDSEVSVSVSSYDYGAYGKIECDVTMLGQVYSAHIPSGSQYYSRIPRDDNQNNIADGWVHDQGQAADDDSDQSANNTNDGDGLTAYQEYRGVDVDGNGSVSTWERLNPSRKDLFVENDGFEGEYPFLWGNAFDEAEIEVHELLGGYDDCLDALVVTLANQGGHIWRRGDPNSAGVRDWMWWHPIAESAVGGSDQYGSPCAVNKTAVSCLFEDKPHRDHNTWMQAGQWDSDYDGNGVLDPVLPVRVEDTDDDGFLDDEEKDGDSSPPHDDGDDSFDGDYPVRNGSGWLFDRDLSPWDIDNDGLIELPRDNQVPVPSDDEASKARVVRHLITHEMGHAVGINGPYQGHCDDPTCLMYRYSTNFKRDGHFCDDCRAQILIHND